MDARALGAWHESVDVRTEVIHAGLHRGTNVTSDYALVQRAAPFLHRLRPRCLTIVLEGRGRFDEDGGTTWLDAGDVVLSDPRRGGTEAYSATSGIVGYHALLTLDWDEAVGLSWSAGHTVVRLGSRDQRRVRDATALLAGPRAPDAVAEVVAVLRSVGLGFERVAADDLAGAVDDPELRVLDAAVGEQLSKLETRPAIEDLTTSLGWNARRLHRRFEDMAERYVLAWGHWRAALHYARVLQAVRLLAAPGATTESVAAWAGFRAPSALCHTLANAGLPSPGELARAARRDALDGWSGLAHRAAQQGSNRHA